MNSTPACTGSNPQIFSSAPSGSHEAAVNTYPQGKEATHKIASLFCEPSETFTTAEHSEELSEERTSESNNKKHSEELRRSLIDLPAQPNVNPGRKGRREKRREILPASSTSVPAEDPLEPSTEALPQRADPGDVKLTPWTPPANSWPPKQSDGCGGNGPYYACMAPERVRDVETK
jgi:hypothetical protein